MGLPWMRLEIGKSVILLKQGEGVKFFNFLISSLIQESPIQLLNIIFSEF